MQLSKCTVVSLKLVVVFIMKLTYKGLSNVLHKEKNLLRNIANVHYFACISYKVDISICILCDLKTAQGFLPK